MIDAIGTMTTQHNLELVIVEASSGMVKENIKHTIEDTLKLLECGVFALRKEAFNYNDASLETFKKLKVYVVQCIKTQVTLSELSLENADKWKFVELRTAKLPTTWSDRIMLVQYLELLATLYEGCLESQVILKQLANENLDLVPFFCVSYIAINDFFFFTNVHLSYLLSVYEHICVYVLDFTL